MNIQKQPVVGRLAPSPTGGLHVGHARTFLIAWLAARSVGGQILLRIEDIDGSRNRSGATEAAIRDLRWLGLDWDEGPDIGGPNAPYFQSERRDRYDAALDRLKADELVYPCTCSRADIARAASAPHSEDEGPRYPGTCAGRSVSDGKPLPTTPYCWRFRVRSGFVTWDDLVRGQSRGEPVVQGGDFIVGRSSGEPAYQLAVVCDDAAMGVNQVIRGDDLILSTPRQLLLYRTLGLSEPKFGHVPLVYGADGKRLAKRVDSIKLAALRATGTDPSELVALLANSIGIAGLGTCVTPAELLSSFRLEMVPETPWVLR